MSSSGGVSFVSDLSWDRMSAGDGPEEPGRERDGAYGPWVEQFILPFVREGPLWPVLIVVITHAAVFLAPLMLLSLRDGKAAAGAALVGFALLSAVVIRYEVRRLRRIASLGGVIFSTWLLSAALAWVSDRYGFF